MAMARRWTPQRFVTLRRIRVIACIAATSIALAGSFAFTARKSVALNINGQTTQVTTYAMTATHRNGCSGPYCGFTGHRHHSCSSDCSELKKRKEKGGGREGDVPAPLKARSWLGDAPPSFQEAHNWGKAPGVLTQGKNYMRRKVYVSHNTPFFLRDEPLVGIEPTTCRLQGGRSGHLS